MATMLAFCNFLRLGPSPVTTAANPDIPFSSASFSCIGSDFDRDSSPMHRKNLSIPDNYLLGKKDNRKLRCWSKATIWEPLDFLFFHFFHFFLLLVPPPLDFRLAATSVLQGLPAFLSLIHWPRFSAQKTTKNTSILWFWIRLTILCTGNCKHSNACRNFHARDYVEKNQNIDSTFGTGEKGRCARLLGSRAVVVGHS